MLWRVRARETPLLLSRLFVEPSSLVPFPALFPFPLCLLGKPPLPRPGQTKSYLLFPAMPSVSGLCRCPRTPPPCAFSVPPMRTASGSFGPPSVQGPDAQVSQKRQCLLISRSNPAIISSVPDSLSCLIQFFPWQIFYSETQVGIHCFPQ